MNTSKQVNVMIGAIFASFILFVGYMGYEATRQAHAREEITERVAERGARLYVNNCRSCHGLEGEGHVAPPLDNKAFLILGPDNEYGAEPTPQGEADAVHAFLFNTIACGRTGTFMPLWAQRFGGSLSDTQINQIVTLITEGRWDLVRHYAAEHDAELFADVFVEPLPRNFDDLPRSEQRELTRRRAEEVARIRHELEEQISHGEYPDVMREGGRIHGQEVEPVLVKDPSTLSVTEANCGQYTAETAQQIKQRDPLVGADAGGPAAGPAQPTPAGTPPPPPPPGTVLSILTEFAIASNPNSAPAGSVTFRAQNNGAIVHELAVFRTDLAPDAIPVVGGRADESRVQVIGRTGNIAARRSEDLRVNLTPGQYVLVCNIPAHYQSGMRAGFTVQ